MALSSPQTAAEQAAALADQAPSLDAHDHPLAHTAGIFADDPLWEDFIDVMQEERRQRNIAEGIETEETR